MLDSQLPRGNRAVALTAFALAMAGGIAVALYQVRLGSLWVPDVPGETIAFLNFAMPHPLQSYEMLAGIEIVWSAAVILAATYANALRAAFGRALLWALLGAQAVGLTAMLLSPFPMDSDQFAYVYYGSMTLRHVNPYPNYSAPIPLTPLEARLAVHWSNPPYVDRYGPAWTLGNALALAPVHALPAEAQARWLRVLAALAALACTVLFARILPATPWRDAALVAAALNPLTIMSTGNGGHNDIFLLLFGLLAWFAAARGAFEWAGAALATAVCVKFAYAPLTPALFAYTYAMTGSWKRTARVLFVFVLAIVLFSVPLGVRESFLVPVISWNGTHVSSISYYLWRAVNHLLHMHGIGLRPFGMAVPCLVFADGIAIGVLALQRKRNAYLEIALGVLILALPYKIESWYGIMVSPLLLVRHRFAPIAFIAITNACEFLQMRIFYASSHPYAAFISLAILIAVVVNELWSRTPPSPGRYRSDRVYRDLSVAGKTRA